MRGNLDWSRETQRYYTGQAIMDEESIYLDAIG